ncbi:hypothetical protein F2P81_022767 [Scophthalmus maximus]|uniref:Uncharacterized protein n=1 Tax=Scophthalmus maximus TaxID=52904 RepID=A0A6A4RT86_SCOMX|nr:hypothetical protein F2P81_022767 [Scophthalmus maximus]
MNGRGPASVPACKQLPHCRHADSRSSWFRLLFPGCRIQRQRPRSDTSQGFQGSVFRAAAAATRHSRQRASENKVFILSSNGGVLHVEDFESFPS